MTNNRNSFFNELKIVSSTIKMMYRKIGSEIEGGPVFEERYPIRKMSWNRVSSRARFPLCLSEWTG